MDNFSKKPRHVIRASNYCLNKLKHSGLYLWQAFYNQPPVANWAKGYLESSKFLKFVTRPAKRNRVGTKYTISKNRKYLKFCVLSVSFKMLSIKVWQTFHLSGLSGSLIIMQQIWNIQWNFMYPCTWSIFVGSVTFTED